MADDPLLVKGTWTLKNKFGERNLDAAQTLERRLSTLAAKQGIPEGRFDAAHLKLIHKHLFGKMYDWAGQFRDTPLQRFVMQGEGSQFEKPDKLEERMSTLNDFIKHESKTATDPIKASIFIAAVYSQLNEIHPFREGNGRTAKSFTQKLAQSIGYEIDLKNVLKQQWDRASEKAFKGNQQELQDVFYDATKKIELGRDPVRIIGAVLLYTQKGKEKYQDKGALISALSKLSGKAKLEYIADNGKRKIVAIENRDGVVFELNPKGIATHVLNIQTMPNIESWEHIKKTLSPTKKHALAGIQKTKTKQLERGPPDLGRC